MTISDYESFTCDSIDFQIAKNDSDNLNRMRFAWLNSAGKDADLGGRRRVAWLRERTPGGQKMVGGVASKWPLHDCFKGN